MRKLARLLFHRAVFVALLLVLQISILILCVWRTSRYSGFISGLFILLSLAVMLYIVGRRDNPAFKLVWLVQIALFPIFGGLFYLLFNFQSSTRRMRRRLDEIGMQVQKLLPWQEETERRLLSECPACAPQAVYLRKTAGFPAYHRTRAEYLSPGERKQQRLLEELAKAERFIFMEYFIIEPGKMWDPILCLLRQKAAAGVEVRVMYDGMGCLMTLPDGYDKLLRSYGIQCVVFNPFRPVLSSVQNNRDHRKIVVIDGRVAFTGGINLADEYINAYKKHGHWKDASILLRGDAVWSFTILFLQLWSLQAGPEEDFDRYRCKELLPEEEGYIIPYADSPMDNERVGESVYLQMIACARHTLYINTPYLIIDNEMMTALCLAAKSGVDVRIVTPHYWDKWLIHMATRSYYPELIDAGVKIYEYSDGFIHSKTFVSDGQTAVVGSINLDYRSLYLHFECGVWLHGGEAVQAVQQDFLNTLSHCEQITQENYPASFLLRLLQKLLQLFAPLL